jgi:hypothetical protein
MRQKRNFNARVIGPLRGRVKEVAWSDLRITFVMR